MKLKPEKNSGPNGIRAHDPCDTGAVLYQLGYQANWELATLWVRNVPVEGEEYKWIYESSYIWTAESDVKMWSIIALFPVSLATILFYFQRFAIEERLVDGIRLNVPADPEKLASEINQSRFTGCNLTNIQRYYSKYGRDISSDAILFKRKALEVLSAAMNALDRLGVRFWLSSGTCLGK